jgi:glycosyltransferase involved in cell wall biosynthesis
MINDKKVAVVVPCYNEETQIEMVLESMPAFVDRIIVINDCSTDKTEEIVKGFIKNEMKKSIIIEDVLNKIKPNRHNKADIISQEIQKKEIEKFVPFKIYNLNNKDRIVLINHVFNSGKGAGIATGYKWAKDHGIECTASMDGDGQMDPQELESICRPIIEDDVDYVKGNRLIHRSSLLIIPKIRFLGNSILSILTKLASGYWKISDTQTGYTAISLRAINSIRLYEIYKSYGYPNDVLVKLNIAFCSIREIAIKPVYDIGEQSKMNILKVVPTVSWLLFTSFFKRLWVKYLFRDFHPLFLLYNSSFLLGFGAIIYGYKVTSHWYFNLPINQLTVMAFMFLFISGSQSFLFAMWMDIQDNERLLK